MSYNLLIPEVREGKIQEKIHDLIGFSSLFDDEIFMVLPDGNYDIGGVDNLIDTNMKEEEFLNPLNLALVVEEVKKRFGDPRFLVLPHSSFGMDCGPYLSGYFGVPIITDVSDVKEGAFQKSFYSDKVFAEFAIKDGSFFVFTIRSGSFKGTPKMEKKPKKTEIELYSRDDRRSFVAYVYEEEKDVDISKADFLLSIGRGVGNKDEIPAYEKLAGRLKAVLSASRPVIDKMWLPKSRQVGISGKTVKPKVYLAMGISGSFQHVQGMKDAECIIAVNKDPQAPIFEYAHFGIVEDMHKIRDKLIELLEGKE